MQQLHKLRMRQCAHITSVDLLEGNLNSKILAPIQNQIPPEWCPLQADWGIGPVAECSSRAGLKIEEILGFQKYCRGAFKRLNQGLEKFRVSKNCPFFRKFKPFFKGLKLKLLESKTSRILTNINPSKMCLKFNDFLKFPEFKICRETM